MLETLREIDRLRIADMSPEERQRLREHIAAHGGGHILDKGVTFTPSPDEICAAERARIRQLALAHAEKWLADGSEFAAQALRELAEELGESL